MHILFLTDNFPPEVNAPASRTFEHCREWAKAGHQVTVITGAPNFPTGKLFAGYRNRLFSRERMDGIEVIRVWSYITANEGFVKRSLDYVSFAATAVLASFSVRRPDVVIGTSPQFFTVCAAWLVGLLKRRPFVFELRDLWPESIKAVGALKDGPALRALERVEAFLYRRAALIVTVTHAFKDVLVRRGVDPRKIEVVTNGADLSRFAPTPKDMALADRIGIGRRFVVGYIGTIGMAHALGTVLEAARRVEQAGLGNEIVFLILGDGAEKRALKTRAQELGLTSVVFLDSVPKAEVVHYWGLLDAALVHLKNDALFSTVLPSKIFECMAMGLPILHGVKGESAELVERERVGLVFEPENPDDLLRKLEALRQSSQLRARLSSNGLQAAVGYDRSELARRMLGLLLKAVHGRSAEHIRNDSPSLDAKRL